MTNTTKKNDATKVIRKAFENSFELFSELNNVNGVKVTPFIKGVNANDGFVVAFPDGYVEVWDNSDSKRSNIAVRPNDGATKALYIDLTKLNNVDGIRVTTPKKQITSRIAVYDSNVLNNLIHRIVTTLKTLVETTTKGKNVKTKDTKATA